MAATTLLRSDQFLALPEGFDQHGNRIKDANPAVPFDSLVEAGTQVSQYDSFVPDVAVVKVGEQPLSARIHMGAPEIAVGVVSPLLPGFSSPVAAFFELT